MRNRWMFNVTGLPGWMRFGFSPGWVGRSPNGLGPCASYLVTGQWPTPQAQAFWDSMQSGNVSFPFFGIPPVMPMMEPQDEVRMLKLQADILSKQIEQINARIKDLENK